MKTSQLSFLKNGSKAIEMYQIYHSFQFCGITSSKSRLPLVQREKEGESLGLRAEEAGKLFQSFKWKESYFQKFRKGTWYPAKDVIIVWVAKQLHKLLNSTVSKFCYFNNELQFALYYLEKNKMYFVVIEYFSVFHFTAVCY